MDTQRRRTGRPAWLPTTSGVVPLNHRGTTPTGMFYGMPTRCPCTEFAKAYPLEASQLMDHVMAPRIDGQLDGGTNVPQLVRAARQSRALLTTDGLTTPPPAADEEAGS